MTIPKDTAIKVENIHKDFFLPHSKSDTLKHKLINLHTKKRKGGEIQHALKGISFEVKKGDFFGILGRNGSGKSTLLKIMSEIYQPTKGKVTKRGSLVPFIELGVGFNPELSGRENVFLNGAMLGFSRSEMLEMYDEIVQFAELEEFMEKKLKNYSSGMKVRLGFSIAIRANSDILLLDEVLAVGDASFQRKCTDYFQTLKDNKKTIILVTHNMAAVKEYCNKAILIDNGKIKLEGDADKVSDEYLKIFNNATLDQNAVDLLSESIKFEDIKLIQDDKDINISLKVKALKDIKDLIVGLKFSINGIALGSTNTKFAKNGRTIDLKKNTTKIITLNLPNMLGNGTYFIDIAATSGGKKIFEKNKALKIENYINNRKWSRLVIPSELTID
jgi:ABC-2 type transport system ATP-binding protein